MSGASRVILRASLRDGLRSRLVYGFGGFFLLAGWGLYRLGGGGDKLVLSLLSLTLALVPLVCLVFGAASVYQSRRFIELMLAQPVPRGTLFRAVYLGLALPLALAWLLGCLPWLVFAGGASPVALLLFCVTGIGLGLACCSLALLLALAVDNRLRGLGLALGLWLLLVLAWDALVLAVAYTFADWPLEGVILGLCLVNPVDLARVLVLLQFDLGALMGYTGAVFKLFFQSATGTALALASLGLWITVPLLMAGRIFRKKDF